MSEATSEKAWEVCPGCQKLCPNVGPWSGEGEGGHQRLCGACKARVTLADPDRRRLEEDIKAALAGTETVELGRGNMAGIGQLLAPYAERGRQRARGRR